MLPRILIVDDEPDLVSVIVYTLEQLGYDAHGVNTLERGLKTAEEGPWDVVLLDIRMPDGDGLDLLPRFVKSRYQPEVIIMTGATGSDLIARAIQGGAWTYIDKQNLFQDLQLHLLRALQYRREKQRVSAPPFVLKRKNIIGESEAIQLICEELAKAAVSEVNVLICGETGTGKEIFARTIHENSPRAKENYIVVDCASLPENLIESALFGHSKGAFTGADSARNGLIKYADGGTLFLDEVGELPPSMQKTFLRILQERCYRPLGSTKEIYSDFRLVAATNRDLDIMVEEGTFRKDLLYRLKGLTIQTPPLRDHMEDIKALTLHYTAKLSERYVLDTKGIAPDFFDALSTYDWPGNVRELFHTLEEVFAGAISAPTLFCIHLPEPFRIRMVDCGRQLEAADSDVLSGSPAKKGLKLWRDYKQEIEREYLVELLAEAEGNIKAACVLSGLSRARLYQLMNKYDISDQGSKTC